MWTKSKCYIGGHRMELLEASVEQISIVLGEPYRQDDCDFPDDPYKVNVCWCVETKDSSIVTIWDYKQLSQPDSKVRLFSIWYNHESAWLDLHKQIKKA